MRLRPRNRHIAITQGQSQEIRATGSVMSTRGINQITHYETDRGNA